LKVYVRGGGIILGLGGGAGYHISCAVKMSFHCDTYGTLSIDKGFACGNLIKTCDVSDFLNLFFGL